MFNRTNCICSVAALPLKSERKTKTVKQSAVRESKETEKPLLLRLSLRLTLGARKRYRIKFFTAKLSIFYPTAQKKIAPHN
jgi:hypothetical protein